MASNANAVGNACCFTGMATTVDPLMADNIVVAGEVGGDGDCCGDETATLGCALAMIYFPMQTYRAGFCPAEALSRGTLFPELVSDYQRGC